MQRLPLFLFLVISTFPCLLFAQDFTPTSTVVGQEIDHQFYKLSYIEAHENAQWVYYEIHGESNKGWQKRTNDFRADYAADKESAALSDYKGSGYDRGHLCPAGDMKQSFGAMSASFFMSNMSPQRPGFNRGVWRLIEAQVRTWSRQSDDAWIVTGPVLDSTLHVSIGDNKVTVPDWYYKIILTKTNETYRVIGFLIQNEKSDQPLSSFVVSVDKIESVTGIDFFPQLNDSLESALEAQTQTISWTWDKPKTYTAKKHKDSPTTSIALGGKHNANTLYKTRSGKKYHKATCRFLKSSRIPVTPAEAKSAGLGPCGSCKP